MTMFKSDVQCPHSSQMQLRRRCRPWQTVLSMIRWSKRRQISRSTSRIRQRYTRSCKCPPHIA